MGDLLLLLSGCGRGLGQLVVDPHRLGHPLPLEFLNLRPSANASDLVYHFIAVETAGQQLQGLPIPEPEQHVRFCHHHQRYFVFLLLP